MADAAGRKKKTRVGPYDLGKTVGEGSFAKVKLARDSRTGRARAVKVLDRSHVLRHKMVDQIKREISTMKLIKHPNVVQLHEVMASKSKIYMVLEFVDGGELFDKIVNSGRLGEDEARRYFQQLINAVDYCHSRGVYHRDLKPENLLLDSHGSLKVSDFGLSAFAPQTKEDGLLHTACGTPNYVAPEVLADKGYDGMAADVWSCGVILFVLVAGYLPFDDANLMRLYKMRIKFSGILEDEWFKKDYKPPHFEQGEDVCLDDVDAAFNDSEEHLVAEKREKPESMNAFALISRSQSFNLGNLFEKEMMGTVKRETSFTSQCTPQEIMSKIEAACGPLGFNVRKQNYKMKLKGDKSGRKGHLSVATEVFEVAPTLHMVELRKTGGDTLEFHNFYKSFSSELKDIVWKSESEASRKQIRLAYLHEGLEPKVVHRDIKSSNILLDQQWNAKVSDFGLAKLLCSERSYVTTRVMGTFGYVAPEYASTGMLTERSDVYSFGVLIMEIITGRSPVDYTRAPGEVNLVEWLKTMVAERRAEEVVDPKLAEKPSPKTLKRALLVALRCVDPDANKRPKMGHVIHMLEMDDLLFRDDRKPVRDVPPHQSSERCSSSKEDGSLRKYANQRHR